MSFWGTMAGGFVGTLVLTTLLRGASELRVTRIDLPFLLGTIVTADRRRAKALGYLLHFFFGFFFALGYYAVFEASGRAGWLPGAALGLVHGLFTATALVNVLLPVVHPRMGTALSSIGSEALLEPPGFLMLNYGRGSPLASLVAHVAYGTLVGGFGAFG
ncbi:MAG TPA: hypothetical protein VFS16_15830 [Acidimicrobiia bacterium]|nr:hypothetical protein [Acidimicrobiia bacterium]